jgi:hypothetical protein
MKAAMRKQMITNPMMEPMTIVATSPDVIVEQLEPLTRGMAEVPFMVVPKLDNPTQLEIMLGVNLTQLLKIVDPFAAVPVTLRLVHGTKLRV